MKLDANELNNIFDKLHNVYKKKHISCTIQEVYSNLDNKQDKLIRKEFKLKDENRVILGAEYNDAQEVAFVYTEDSNGRRQAIDMEKSKDNSKVNTLAMMKSNNRLATALENKAKQQTKEPTVKEPTSSKSQEITPELLAILSAYDKRA